MDRCGVVFQGPAGLGGPEGGADVGENGVLGGYHDGWSEASAGSRGIADPLLGSYGLVGGGVEGAGGITLHPVTAAALLTVGWLMMRNVTRIRWEDPGDAIPAFLTIAIMPLALSIADGLAFGFISYAVLRAVSGRVREVSWLVYALAGLFALRFALS